MTDNNHPITPSPELVKQWLAEFYGPESMPGMAPGEMVLHVAAVAARWGADQELDACCEWFAKRYGKHLNVMGLLRAARRPLSLKKQALEAAYRFYANGHDDCSEEEIKDDFDIIRRALEQLDD